MNKHHAVILKATIFCLSLQAADVDEQLPFRVCGEDNQKIGYDREGVFDLAYYPSDDPFIVFGQEKARRKSETAIKTSVVVRRFVSGILVLHSKSSNHRNLELVHNNFLDGFTDTELLKGRVDENRYSLILQQAKDFTKENDIKLYEELLNDANESKRLQALKYVKLLRAKDDFVRCKLYWRSLIGEKVHSKVTHFRIPMKRNASWRYNPCDFNMPQDCPCEYCWCRNLPPFAYGLKHDFKKREVPDLAAQMKRERKRLGIVVAAHKYALEINDHAKPNYAQISFFAAGGEKAIESNDTVAQELRIFENNVLRKKKLYEKPPTFLDSLFGREKEPFPHPYKWYAGIKEESNRKLSAGDVLAMLQQGTKECGLLEESG